MIKVIPPRTEPARSQIPFPTPSTTRSYYSLEQLFCHGSQFKNNFNYEWGPKPYQAEISNYQVTTHVKHFFSQIPGGISNTIGKHGRYGKWWLCGNGLYNILVVHSCLYKPPKNLVD